ncbi:MAG: enoyl-CoA hydratase [Myxococcota bacterium]|jgi:enoyl-CoA hydratase
MVPTSEDVSYSVAERVATVTITREKRRNALNSDVLRALIAAFGQAKADPEVRVVVLTGAGDRSFSAGGDLAPGGMMGKGPLATHWDRAEFVRTLLAMRDLGKPLVARVNGAALGGGFGLLLGCDIAIGRDDAKIGCPEIDVGLFPMMIMALIFRNVPRKVGMELILTARRITGAEAVGYGILNRAVAADALDAAVNEMTANLASKSPAILRLGLNAFHTMSDMAYEDALTHLHTQLTINTLAEDAGEGIMAFLQKRKPEWKGR